MSKEKPNCYECKHRGGVAGDCHSCCQYPGNDTGLLSIFVGSERILMDKLNIKANPHGVKSGWFMWPVNFDPIWLENCDGFEAKEIVSGE